MRTRDSRPVGGRTRGRVSIGSKSFFTMILILGLSGCHSAYMNAVIQNREPAAISVVQVEYPSASFGTQTISPGGEYPYRFKVLGSGPMKITYTDSSKVEHKVTGPMLKESDEGNLVVVVAGGKVDWRLALSSH